MNMVGKGIRTPFFSATNYCFHQLSYAYLLPAGFEPALVPWKGNVLTLRLRELAQYKKKKNKDEGGIRTRGKNFSLH